MKEGKPKWKSTCEQCMRCVNACKKEAIFQTFGEHTEGKARYLEPHFSPYKLQNFENQTLFVQYIHNRKWQYHNCHRSGLSREIVRHVQSNSKSGISIEGIKPRHGPIFIPFLFKRAAAPANEILFKSEEIRYSL